MCVQMCVCLYFILNIADRRKTNEISILFDNGEGEKDDGEYEGGRLGGGGGGDGAGDLRRLPYGIGRCFF